MIKTVKHYFSLVLFAHTIFAMPFALIGFFLGLKTFQVYTGFFTRYEYAWYPTNANKYFDFPKSYHEAILRFVLVILCMVFARSAAMAFNRWLDAEFDAKNPRTAIREIPSGVIQKRNAMIFVVINCLAFLACTYLINPLCFALAPVALFVILFYSYTKRFTSLCHLVLGLGLSLAPIGAYVAVTGKFSLVPVLFSIAVICWVGGFDIIYALQDESFDRENDLHSIPTWLGVPKALSVSELLHFTSFASIAAAGIIGHFGWLYWCGAAVFGFFLIYQHRLVKPNDLSKVNRAFFASNGIASVIFAAFVIADIFNTFYS